jgi:hypothetical protein
MTRHAWGLERSPGSATESAGSRVLQTAQGDCLWDPHYLPGVSAPGPSRARQSRPRRSDGFCALRFGDHAHRLRPLGADPGGVCALVADADGLCALGADADRVGSEADAAPRPGSRPDPRSCPDRHNAVASVGERAGADGRGSWGVGVVRRKRRSVVPERLRVIWRDRLVPCVRSRRDPDLHEPRGVCEPDRLRDAGRVPRRI